MICDLCGDDMRQTKFTDESAEAELCGVCGKTGCMFCVDERKIRRCGECHAWVCEKCWQASKEGDVYCPDCWKMYLADLEEAEEELDEQEQKVSRLRRIVGKVAA